MAKPTTSTNSVVAAAADTRGDHGNRQPLLRRKMDTLYFVFFVIHIPVMLCKSFAPLFSLSSFLAFALLSREERADGSWWALLHSVVLLEQ